MRDEHPHYKQLQRENDREAATFVHPDASAWADRLVKDAIAKRLNIVIDQSSKDPYWLLKQTEKLRSSGYQIELRVMAVSDEISEQRIHTRYENEKAKYGVGRFVPAEVHRVAYEGLPNTLAAVEREKAVDALKVYDKNQALIYDNRLEDGEWQKPPLSPEALENERHRALTLEERKALVAEYERLAEMLDARNAKPEECEIIENSRIQAVRRLEIKEEVKQLFALEPDNKMNLGNISAKVAVNDLEAITLPGEGEGLKQTAKLIVEKLDEIRNCEAESGKAEIGKAAMIVAALCSTNSALTNEIAHVTDADSRVYSAEIIEQGAELNAKQPTQDYQAQAPDMEL